MSTSSLIKTLAQQSEELTRDIDSFSDRAFELARLAKSLQERAARTCVDKSTQVETATVGAPTYHLERAKRLAPFSFTPCDRKLNWRKLRALNVERVVRDTDTRSLQELFGEVAFADLERESVYDMTEANLLKLVRVLQLLLQHQQWQLEQLQGQRQTAREEAAAAAGLLGLLPGLEMGGLDEGLTKLKGDFYQVADADMDAMFAQVRIEERTAARDTLSANVDQVKQALDLGSFGPAGSVGGAGGPPSAAAGGRTSQSALAAAASAAAAGSSRPAVVLPAATTAAAPGGRGFARLSAASQGLG
ncbi:hypothetical protein Agub_g3371 [Astrephomene gubernaculifera]|uniref:Cilium assembly protein DZIP1 N-terminal domain-containing protein n=1 Tax=Astrephomene gubernaculifera TaxID=47775 RepID=A0AAD3DJ33_9CHLO|nr:hypothetical protein Agub_g3371 [Astrephomene gubernaculifera]